MAVMDADHAPPVDGQMDLHAASRLMLWARIMRNDRWDQPEWARCAIAAAVVSETLAGHDPIEHALRAALIARIRWRSGEPPVSGEISDWREDAYVQTRTALGLIIGEQPPLTGRKDVRAVTDPNLRRDS